MQEPEASAGSRGIVSHTKAAEPSSAANDGPNQTPVLIYIPGLGTSAENTADVVADVIAEKADLGDSDRKFTADTAKGVVTPPGLTVSKTVRAPDGSPVLQ